MFKTEDFEFLTAISSSLSKIIYFNHCFNAKLLRIVNFLYILRAFCFHFEVAILLSQLTKLQ